MISSHKLSLILLVFRLSNLVHCNEENDSEGQVNEDLSGNVVEPEEQGDDDSQQPVLLKQDSITLDEDTDDGASKLITEGGPLHHNGSLLGQLDDYSAILNKFQRAVKRISGGWPMGVVPYYIDTKSYDKIIAYRIRKAMRSIEKVSCVVFKNLRTVPNPFDEGNWLHINNSKQERDCVHHVDLGTDGETVMVLGFDCMSQRDILHALMHVLGFKDEVGHPQRDQFIRIMWENIQPKYRSLFRINTEGSPFKIVEYDTMSIMHFHDRAFSIDGGATIAPLIPGLVINPSNNLSQLDVMKLRLAFGHECNKRKVGKLLDTCKKAMQADDAVEENDESTENTYAKIPITDRHPLPESVKENKLRIDIDDQEASTSDDGTLKDLDN